MIWTLVTLLFIGWIYSNSLQNGPQSTSVSEKVRDFLQTVYSSCFPKSDFTFSLHFVRKAAHFSEYALLGFLLHFTLKSYGLPWKQALFTAGGMLMLVAFSDESLQFLSAGRHPAVLDACIDISGGVCGYAFAWCTALLIAKLIRKRAECSRS